MKKKILLNLIILATPIISFSAERSFKGLVGAITDIVRSIIPILVSFALLGFFWGIAKFILNAGNGGEKEEAKNVMLWGIIALFVIVSVWGIVAFLQASFLSGPQGTVDTTVSF